MNDQLAQFSAQLAQIEANRAGLESLRFNCVETRKIIVENSDQDPVAAGHLLNLIDQRDAVLIEAIAAHTRMIEIITTLGASSEDPVKELSELTSGILDSCRVVGRLTEEAKKIRPGSVIRGEGLVQ